MRGTRSVRMRGGGCGDGLIGDGAGAAFAVGWSCRRFSDWVDWGLGSGLSTYSQGVLCVLAPERV